MWWLVSTAAAMDLSYDDALKRAIERNPDLVGEQYTLESAQGQLVGSKGIFDPLLYGSADYSNGAVFGDVTELGVTGVKSTYQASIYQLFPTGTQATLYGQLDRTEADLSTGRVGPWDESAGLSIVQPILQGIMPYYNLAPVREAKRYVDLQTAVLAQQREQTLADTANAYWDLYYRRRVADIAQAAVAAAQEEQRVVHARVDAGNLPPVERSRVDALVVQAQSAVVTTGNDAQASNDRLLLVIGEPLGPTVSLTTEPAPIPDGALDETAIVTEALENNPELAASRINEETAALDFRDAGHARLPQLNAKGSVGVQALDEQKIGSSTPSAYGEDGMFWTIGADITMPLLNRADRGGFHGEEAIAAKARIDREAMERSIDQQVRAQVRTVSSASMSVALAEANLQFAEETLTSQRALQSAGRAIQKDVLDAIRDVDNARVALAKAHADAALALVELNRLRGSL
jgi:outer membrane protein TolC